MDDKELKRRSIIERMKRLNYEIYMHETFLENAKNELAYLKEELKDSTVLCIDSFNSVEKVAELLNVNKETIRRWCRNGKLEGVMRSKKEGLVISSESLLRFLEDHPKYKNLCGEI